MPSPVTFTYAFAAGLEGFASTVGAVAWLATDGQNFVPAAAPGCLQNAGTTGSGAIVDTGGGFTARAEAAVAGVTWESLGVPAGVTVTRVSWRLMARTVTHTHSDSALLLVGFRIAGVLFLGGDFSSAADSLNLYAVPGGTVALDGAWHTDSALEADNPGITVPWHGPFDVPGAQAASDTAFDLALGVVYHTNAASDPSSTFVVDVRIDTLELTIEYVDLSVDLTETLALIVADPAGLTAIITDPAAGSPPGGTGLPVRFEDGGFTDSCDPTDAGATVCTRSQRVIPVALAAHLAGTALTLAYCLRLERRDGEVFGFTTHDANLSFGGVTYEALNSLSVTALRQETGGGVGTLDLAGLIRSDRVTAADLLAGRYDGAELTLALVNWASLADGGVTLARGWFGAVTLADGSWKAEYRSLGQKFAQEVVEVTSALCRVRQLGDARCAPGGVFGNGAALSHYQFTRTVSVVLDTRRMTFAADTHASGYYHAGRVVFSTGANADLEREIKTHTLSGGAAVLEMQEGFPFTIEVGDTAMLEAGCDRRIHTCRARFNNVVNYQAEPHVPGFDILKRLAQANLTG
jgi:uncharacterized phage protein (TIGR02218 family)